jgi:hypothetical protein
MHGKSGISVESLLNVLRIARLLHWALDRRCPACSSVEIRGSSRRTFFEAALQPFLFVRPFRCESCGNRFYGPAFLRRVPARDHAQLAFDLPLDLPVLVYGRRKDEEPFWEETTARLLSPREAVITLTTTVEPGQPLVLINLVTEQDQACHVAFVAEKDLGQNIIGIQFGQLV